MTHSAILLVVPVLTLIFALGEQFRWWDKISRRDAAIKGKERFYSAEGYPQTWIYRNRKEDKAIFDALEKRINRRTLNETVKNLAKQGIRPDLITVAGSRFHITGLEPGMKSTVYSDVHPVMYIYHRNNSEEGKGKAAQVASLGDLSKWLEDEKANRRFWVISVLVGILSLAVAFVRVAF